MSNRKIIIKKSQPKSEIKRRPVIGILLILLVTFGLFSPAIRYDFVNWDDDINTYENENVVNFDIKGIFTDRVIGNYNPLSIFSMAVDYQAAGGKPWLLHLNNILLHLACTLLVYLVLKRLGVSYWITIMAALLFGIHPMRVESVAWITERKDVLFGFFYLLSLLFYIEFTIKRKAWIYVVSLAIFILSLLSKIQAVSLPLSMLLIDYWLNRKPDKKLILEKVPFFALSLFTGLLGVYFLKEVKSLETGETFSMVQRLFIGSYSFVFYLIKAILPLKLSALHPYPSHLNGLYYFSMIPALAVATIPVFTYRKNKYLAFGLAFFIVNIVFLLQVLGAGQGFLAERFSYIAYLGIFLIMAWLIEKAAGKYRNARNVIYGITGVYFIFLLVLSVNQRNTWRDNITLWENVIKKYPEATLAYNNLGHHYRQKNNYEKAFENYNLAIKYDPKNSMAYSNRGKIYFDRGETDLAIEDYNKSLTIKADNSEALSNRGAAYGLKGKYNEALDDLNRALELNPVFKDALSNRGYLNYQKGEYEKTITDYSNYLKLQPNDADIINTIGLSYLNLGNIDKALIEFNKAIQLKPEQAAFYMNRSLVFVRKHEKNNALNDALKAKELGFNVNPLYIEQLKRMP